MLRRQRTILRILATVDGPVAVTQLHKYLFLLQKETFLSDDSAFYEFLPYKFGPYSFAANRELDALSAYSYITSTVSPTTTLLTLTALGTKEAQLVDSNTSRAILAIVFKYGKAPLRTLLKDVYSRYSWYATNSELKDLIPIDAPKQPVAPPAIYTMGYEERSVDGFFNRLLRTGIRRIIDVRANPVSRKYGFARSSFSSIAAKLRIGYTHCPELGISSDKRRDVQTSSEFKQLFSYYERNVLAERTSEMASVAEMMKTTACVLVCMEKEPQDCHRSRLANRLGTSTGLSVIHL